VNSGSGVIDLYPAADGIFREAEKGVGERSVATFDSHEFVGALLALSGEVAICKLVAFQTSVSPTLRAIKNGEGEAWDASDVHFVGRQACSGTDGVVKGEFDVGEMNAPFVWRLLHTMIRIWAIVWLTRLTPPDPQG